MFSESLKEGEAGEHAVWNLFNNLAGVRSVVDVRKDKRFQENDIDFLVEDYKRQWTPIEVKTDFKSQDTGNIIYEVSTSGNLGCFEKTKAKYIAYYIPAAQVVHMIDMVKMRTYLQKARPEERNMGDNATGFLLPIEDLKREKVIYQTHEGVT